ncbi:hypothetical protein RISW2_18000 [Roseivivax isoporae LMG 25204]|uniref:Lipoprotein n=1 Tax=Roseivivax isoporae LMG 25204 TaxID=1449351 RepID=X7FBD5_9RHOB|nr:hypothetical protein RISW2_18000 [Roseivivax isoporae LMG 25204]
MTHPLRLLILLAAMALSACGAAPRETPAAADPAEIAELRQAILALGPDIDPEEADRAARVAYTYPLQLRQSYGVTDSAIVHNIKVNNGTRPRGLCWHWADDMEARLDRENFRTLELHRAIGNAGIPFRIEHSTVIVSARGEDMFDGLVLDPWRWGGDLYWGPPAEDDRYRWEPRQTVLARSGRLIYETEAQAAAAGFGGPQVVN